MICPNMKKRNCARSRATKVFGETSHPLRPGTGERVNMGNDFPTTVDAAVRLLMSMVDESEQAKIAAMDSEDMYTLHFGLGVWIRNHMGFYAGNDQLLKATGEIEPDEASMIIMRALRERLRKDLPKIHGASNS